jgi:hypothetical protein
MILVVHLGSRIPGPDHDFLPIPDPGSRGQIKKEPNPGPGSATLLTLKPDGSPQGSLLAQLNDANPFQLEAKCGQVGTKEKLFLPKSC